MRAIDVMVRDVVTVRPDTDVAEATKLLAEHDVSALPVLDQDGNLIGILSEADLIHRAEIGTEKHRPWWLEAVTGATRLAEEFAKSHGKKVGEVMTTGVISVTEETPLSDIATLFERKQRLALGLRTDEPPEMHDAILGRISKRGSRYLRTLLIQAARVLLMRPHTGTASASARG